MGQPRETFTHAHEYALSLCDRYPHAAAVGFASCMLPDGQVRSRIVATIIRDQHGDPVTGDRMLAEARTTSELSR
jgi:predicted TPR repeat methyltransferase